MGNYLAWYWGGRCRVTQTGPIDQSSGRQCVHPDAAIITQPQGPVNPPDNYLDPAQSVFPFRNFGISDTPYNWDYCFRAGIFCGDYENVTIDTDNNVWAMWTDARNGRSSRTQTGRNPACEQSDAWADTYRDNKDAEGTADRHARATRSSRSLRARSRKTTKDDLDRREEGRPRGGPLSFLVGDCAAAGFGRVALLVGAVGGANQRPGEDRAEAERLALLAEPAELVGMHPAVDRRVLGRGLEVLADRDDVDAVRRAGRASSRRPRRSSPPGRR